jgi:hypothetical protein
MAFPNNPCSINLVHDNSTFANFAAWATAIDACLLAFGWKQSADTGQVMWLGCSVTAAANVSGSTWRYTYSSLTTSGQITAFAIGMVVTMTGWTGGATGNNGTFVIASLAGGAGTFDVVNASGFAVASAGTGVITKQTTVPSSTFVYSIWVSQDTASGTQPIYLKMWYGYSTSSVQFQVTPGSGSNGTGTITNPGNSTPWPGGNLNANQGASVFSSYFSGDSGSFRMYLWQSASINCGILFGVSRSVDSSGAKTADYFSARIANANQTGYNAEQAFSLAAGNGPFSQGQYGWTSSGCKLTTGNYGGVTACTPISPLVPPTIVFGNPLLDFVGIKGGDTGDGATITVNPLYAASHTFIVAKGAFSGQVLYGSNNDSATPAMRYE